MLAIVSFAALLAGCELFRLPFPLLNPHDPERAYSLAGIAGRTPFEDHRGIGGIVDLAVTPDGSLFVATRWIRGFYWFGPDEAARFVPLEDEWGNCIGACWNTARGRFALSCDRAVVEVDPADMSVELLYRNEPLYNDWYEWIAAAPDGTLFATKQWDAGDGRHQAVERFDPSSGQRLAVFDLTGLSYLYGIGVSSDRVILSTGGSIRLCTYDLDYVQELYWGAGTFANRLVIDDSVFGGLDTGRLEYDPGTARLYYSSYTLAPLCSLDPMDFVTPLRDQYGQYSDYRDARNNPVCVDASGRIYVGNCVDLGFVHRFDAPAAVPSDTVYQDPPLEPDEKVFLDDICCDDAGAIYLTQSTLGTVERYDPAAAAFNPFTLSVGGCVTANADHVYVGTGGSISSYSKAGVFEESWPDLGDGIDSLACTSSGVVIGWNVGNARLYVYNPGGLIDGPYQPLVGTPYDVGGIDGHLTVTGADEVVLAVWGNDGSDNSFASFGTVSLATHTYAEIWNTTDAGLLALHQNQRDMFAIADICSAEDNVIWVVFRKLSSAARFEIDGTVLGSLGLHRSGDRSFAWTPSEIVDYSDTPGNWWEESCERIAADADGTLSLKYSCQIYLFEPR